MARRSAPLPQPCIGVVAVADGLVDHRPQELPFVFIDVVVVAMPQVRGIQQVPVHVELDLVHGAVADPHRGRSAPTLEFKFKFRKASLSVRPVHDLEFVTVAG